MTTWLIDKSAISRLHLAGNASEWADRIERGLVRIATVTRLEVGYSARSGADHRTVLHSPPIASMPVEYLTPKIEDRAEHVDDLGTVGSSDEAMRRATRRPPEVALPHGGLGSVLDPCAAALEPRVGVAWSRGETLMLDRESQGNSSNREPVPVSK